MIKRTRRRGEATENYVVVVGPVAQYLWCLDSTGYAATNGPPPDRKMVKLHRFLMNPGDLEVDHISRDTLDNRRANLRVCAQAENLRNQMPRTTWGGTPATCLASLKRRFDGATFENNDPTPLAAAAAISSRKFSLFFGLKPFRYNPRSTVRRSLAPIALRPSALRVSVHNPFGISDLLSIIGR